MRLPPEKTFEMAPAGVHPAICYQILDLGTQEVTYNGETSYSRKVQIHWEMPLEKMEDGRPFSASKRYTYSSSQKSTLRKDLEGWRGKSFTKDDLQNFEMSMLLGRACTITIQHESRGDKDYANVVSVGPAMKGMDLPKTPVNPMRLLDLERGKFKSEVFDSLHERLRELIAKSPEYMHVTRPVNGQALAAARQGVAVSNTLLDDEIPF